MPSPKSSSNSSHYFETALDIACCVSDNPGKPGFYLVKVLGSEQAGLTGVKGFVVRKVAVSHTVSDLRTSLTMIKSALENK
jgi:hypothetical protein